MINVLIFIISGATLLAWIYYAARKVANAMDEDARVGRAVAEPSADAVRNADYSAYEGISSSSDVTLAQGRSAVLSNLSNWRDTKKGADSSDIVRISVPLSERSMRIYGGDFVNKKLPSFDYSIDAAKMLNELLDKELAVAGQASKYSESSGERVSAEKVGGNIAKGRTLQ